MHPRYRYSEHEHMNQAPRREKTPRTGRTVVELGTHGSLKCDATLSLPGPSDGLYVLFYLISTRVLSSLAALGLARPPRRSKLVSSLPFLSTDCQIPLPRNPEPQPLAFCDAALHMTSLRRTAFARDLPPGDPPWPTVRRSRAHALVPPRARCPDVGDGTAQRCCDEAGRQERQWIIYPRQY